MAASFSVAAVETLSKRLPQYPAGFSDLVLFRLAIGSLTAESSVAQRWVADCLYSSHMNAWTLVLFLRPALDW